MAHHSQAIEAFFAGPVRRFTDGLSSLAERVPQDAKPEKGEEFQELLRLLNAAREACREMEAELSGDDVVLRDVQARYQEALEPWFSQSWMMNHARTKPQGYAGDYQMLTTIYEAQPRSTGIGGLLDLFFLGTELGRAVPARKNALQDFLAEEFSARGPNVKVLDVACGPCREFQDGVQAPDGADISVTFVDYDEESLAYSEQALDSAEGPYSFSFVRYNALRMQAPKRFIDEHGRFDVIYSVGLCDYLSDRQLIAMFKGWREMLNPGGVLYVAFKDRFEYDKTDYQWLTDWFFLERCEQDCRRLFLDAGCTEEELSMTRDATGIIMNFAAKAVESPHRVDPAQGLAAPKTQVGERVGGADQG